MKFQLLKCSIKKIYWEKLKANCSAQLRRLWCRRSLCYWKKPCFRNWRKCKSELIYIKGGQGQLDDQNAHIRQTLHSTVRGGTLKTNGSPVHPHDKNKSKLHLNSNFMKEKYLFHFVYYQITDFLNIFLLIIVLREGWSTIKVKFCLSFPSSKFKNITSYVQSSLNWHSKYLFSLFINCVKNLFRVLGHMNK